MPKKSVKDIEVRSKTVFVRADFNVPMDADQQITDETRIIASIPTIQYLVNEGARIVICSHLGRPKGKPNPALSLFPVAERLHQLLQREIRFSDECVGEEVDLLKSQLKDSDILLLENVRFHSAETDNDPDFAKALFRGCDIFVNDAFGTAHRAHASTAGVAQFAAESVSGFLIEKELNFLIHSIEQAKRPFTAIIGGAKISGKIDVIQSLLPKVDRVLIGGGMMFTFYRAMGLEIGTSLVEEEKVELAKSILEAFEKSDARLVLPVDVVVADAFDNEAQTQTVDYQDIPKDLMGLDIGPQTVDLYAELLADSKTVLWNGPMGAFEMPNFSTGTRRIAEQLAEITTNQGAVTIIGGGDSAAAVAQFKQDIHMSHISTGGGASLELLEGKVLPGIDVLDEA